MNNKMITIPYAGMVIILLFIFKILLSSVRFLLSGWS